MRKHATHEFFSGHIPERNIELEKRERMICASALLVGLVVAGAAFCLFI